MILFHISNNFFDLAPVLAAAAEDAGLHYRRAYRFKLENKALQQPSIWFAMARSEKAFSGYKDFDWQKVEYPADTRMWTDDYTDYLGIMRDDVFSFKKWMSKKPAPKPETTDTQAPTGQ